MKADFSSENKVTSPDDFPRLKLKVNEKARIGCIEKAPEMMFVHTLQMYTLDENGQKVMETRKGNRGEYQVPVLQFVGQHVCFGDENTLLKSASGYDPANCPTCAASDEHDLIKKPVRRYAMHVLQYVCQTDSFVVASPLQVMSRAWVFTANRMNTLIDINTEWATTGGLAKHDLLLGPCEKPENMQKFDIQVASDSAWRKNEASMKLAQEVYKNNRAADLSVLISRKSTKDRVTEDIQKVIERNAEASGLTPVTAVQVGTPESAEADVASILDGLDEPTDTSSDPWAKPSEPASDAATEADISELFDKSAPIPEPAKEEPKKAPAKKAAAKAAAPAAEVEATPAAPAAAEGDSAVFDFEDFVSNLDS